jgi:SAM-dependent methyltransferase
MTPEQREAVRENALYLREVRPIDPAEIHEYVEGQPHPAVVGQVLREEAPDLGLIEREDGTFVPVPDDPVETPAGTVERFPDRYARRLEDLLVDRYGPDWPDGDSGKALRESIRRLKEGYFAGRPVTYDETAALGYAIYHLPDYYAAVQYVLDDLIERRLLSRHLRVVDVGAGAGGPALGLADYLPEDVLVEYHGIEPSPAAEVLDAMLEDVGRNVHATIHRERAEDVDPPACDLLVFANVLSELDDPVAVVERYAEALAEDGTVLLLAPADLETSTGLREVERALAGDDPADGISSAPDLTVYSPTVRLWPGHAPRDRCWSFDVRPDLAVPSFQRRLDDGVASNADAGDGEANRGTAGDDEFVNVDVQFSYALLRPDGTRRIEFVPDGGSLAKMAETERHVTGRIDLAAIKLSHDLATEGESDNPLFLIGDGSQRVDHYAVLTRETALNDDLRRAEYGALLIFESVLALWNDDEEAFNLVVDEETVVDAIGPQ